MNSKAMSSFALMRSSPIRSSCGKSLVFAPKVSLPSPQKECQYAIAYRRTSFIFLPPTFASASYHLNARGFFESFPSYFIFPIPGKISLFDFLTITLFFIHISDFQVHQPMYCISLHKFGPVCDQVHLCLSSSVRRRPPSLICRIRTLCRLPSLLRQSRQCYRG